MTMREYHNAIIEANLSDELTEVAKKEIAKLDKRNATPSKAEIEKRAENEALKAKIAEYLADGNIAVASEVGLALNVSTGKASSMLQQMARDAIVNVSEVKVKGKGKVKGYALAVAEAE